MGFFKEDDFLCVLLNTPSGFLADVIMAFEMDTLSLVECTV